ncbi:MAG: hypothetical protein HC895_08225 [Leptolyngbyaceae cyanobacterium SM1_3_5]|nr:hypothetical protein [Leptolyngbyaceae cyanobacterium SM1_3_5]
MTAYRVLDLAKTYTFSQYFDLPFLPDEILGDLGHRLIQDTLTLPRFEGELELLDRLSATLYRNTHRVSLLSETARREAIIAPMLLEVCDRLGIKLSIEYAVRVSDWLKGPLDYYMQNGRDLLVIEAKQSDLSKGFTQLAAELIALSQWTKTDAPVIYGAVTTGEIWKFGMIDRGDRLIVEDRHLYLLDRDLETIVRSLLGALSSGS